MPSSSHPRKGGSTKYFYFVLIVGVLCCGLNLIFLAEFSFLSELQHPLDGKAFENSIERITIEKSVVRSVFLAQPNKEESTGGDKYEILTTHDKDKSNVSKERRRKISAGKVGNSKKTEISAALKLHTPSLPYENTWVTAKEKEEMQKLHVNTTTIKKSVLDKAFEEEIPLFETTTNETKNQTTGNFTVENFENLLWPRLQQQLCPRGLPNLKLGPKLFRLARDELRIPAEITGGLTGKFFNGLFNGVELIMDGNDPSNSLLYVPIWKCGNDQIRDYLKNNFAQNIIERKDAKSVFNFREYMKKHAVKTVVKGKDITWYPPPKRHRENQSNPNGSTPNHRRLSLQSPNPGGTSNRTASANYTYVRLSDAKDLHSFLHKRGASLTQPCIVTAIRDPVSHFLSGYNEIEYRWMTGEGVAKSFAKNQRLLPPYSNITENGGIPNTKESREHRFETFVRNLLEGHARFRSYPFDHVYVMSRVLKTIKEVQRLPNTLSQSNSTMNEMGRSSSLPQNEDNQWVLPTLTNLNERFPKFLAEKCPRFAANYPPMEIEGVHGSSSDPFGTYQSAKDVWKKGGTVARSLCHIHAFDYACFYGTGALTPLGARDIPATCQDVFASDSFRERILGDLNLKKFAYIKKV